MATKKQYITIVEFRGFDRDCFEPFLSDEPLMGHEIKLKIEEVVHTAMPKRVFRYTGENIKFVGVTQYDGKGDIIPPSVKIIAPPTKDEP